jgi:hypothetical protein
VGRTLGRRAPRRLRSSGLAQDNLVFSS